MANAAPSIDLIEIFEDWNTIEFSGTLPQPILRFNSRLQTTAGRFIPARPVPIIEIATYLLAEENAEQFIRDTLGHELIHLWLWYRRRPYGHTKEFWQKMESMGVSRFNPVPKHRPFKHVYICPSCNLEIQTRKKMGRAACAHCCNTHADGNFDSRFILKMAG